MRTVLVILLCLISREFADAQQRAPGEFVVRGLSFEGNRAIDDYTLSISISTSESSLWQRFPLLRPFGLGEKRYFNETEFRRDVVRIELLYRQSGYFEVQVDTVLRRVPRQPEGDIHVRFLITENQPIRVTSISVEGAEGVLPEAELVRELPLRVGDAFNRFWLQASADSIQSVLMNRGYPFAEVFQGFDENRPAHEARIAFTVEPGPPAWIAQVVVEGTDKVDPSVVRRTLSLAPGDAYRKDALIESQRDLYATGLFSTASLTLVDSLPDDPADSLVTIRVRVTEARQQRTRAGAGYGALDCFRGLASWTSRDFLGGGRSLDLTGQLSKLGPPAACPGLRDDTDSTRRRLNYQASLVLNEPFLFARNNAATLSLFAERRSEFNTYLRTARGFELGFTRRIAWQASVTLAYSLVYGRTEADEAVFCSILNLCRLEDSLFNAPRRESTVSLRAVRDRSNSPIDPSRGTNFSAQFRYAAPSIGSDSLSQFARGLVDYASYHRVGRRGVFAWRVRGGAIIPTELAFLTRRAAFVPPTERLYAGGPTTVRGYGQNEMGPVVRVLIREDPTSNDSTIRVSATGGNQLLLANMEYRAPLPIFAGRVSGAVFIDAGGLWTSEGGLTAGQQVRITPGAGIRITTPLGPIRLDVAYRPYDPTPGPLYEISGQDLVLVDADYVPGGTWFQRHVKIHFSVGQAF